MNDVVNIRFYLFLASMFSSVLMLLFFYISVLADNRKGDSLILLGISIGLASISRMGWGDVLTFVSEPLFWFTLVAAVFVIRAGLLHNKKDSNAWRNTRNLVN